MYRWLLLFSMILSLAALNAEIPDQIAQQQLQVKLASIPATQLDKFGFLPGDRMADAVLDSAFVMHTLTNSPEIGTPYTTNTLHLYPVVLNGTYRCMLAVDFTRSEWKAVGVGYRDLAHQLQAIRNAWPGKEVQLVRVLSLQRYYFSLPGISPQNLTRIPFDSADTPGNYRSLMPWSEALTEIRQATGQGR